MSGLLEGINTIIGVVVICVVFLGGVWIGSKFFGHKQIVKEKMKTFIAHKEGIEGRALNVSGDTFYSSAFLNQYLEHKHIDIKFKNKS